jgi:hypothetical protein
MDRPGIAEQQLTGRRREQTLGRYLEIAFAREQKPLPSRAMFSGSPVLRSVPGRVSNNVAASSRDVAVLVPSCAPATS